MRTRAAFSAVLAAALASAASAEMRTFCNPVAIEDYPVGLFCRGLANGSKPSREPETWLTPDGRTVQFRELADPSIICEKGVWYLYPSGESDWKTWPVPPTRRNLPRCLQIVGA